ncbi:MAG: PPC domain-containing protein [Isosphaeraceae bacterium]|nr:PPC domain-containing protein [Isosphaeraceae bacterium]
MTRTLRVLVLAALCAGGRPVLAQRIVTKNAPRAAESVPVVSSIFPPGLTRGATTDWTVTGRNLGTVESFLISGGGVEVVEIKSKSAGTVVVAVRAAADAAPGFREVYAEAPDGLSNLLVVRVDQLPQIIEAEPNDDPAHATEMALGSAAAGVLKPQDLDHFRFAARAGQRVTIEVEAQRLGASITPVATLLASNGVALAQAKPTRGGDRDCRLNLTIPRDGTYLVLVHDNAFGGSESSGYRLRVEEAPFATGLFPLGGPRGQSVTVAASGGNLQEPRSKTVVLPDDPGAIIDPGVFDGPGGLVLAPAKLVVGDGPEVFEPQADDPKRPATAHLPLGATANGRIERPGEVDRFVIAVKKGDRLHVKVQASALGSWLDSVVTLRDVQGMTLAENDDPAADANPRGGVFGLNTASSDSQLDYEAKADGDLFLDITDRYGEGGPEYAYRLSVGPPRPDFEIKLLLANPNANRQLVPQGQRVPTGGPGSTGALNLKPGSMTPINFLVTPSGRPGRVTVNAEGLPPGVTAEPVSVNFTPARGQGRANPTALASSGSLVLKVAPNAELATGVLKVIGTVKLEDGTTLTRTATAALAIDAAAANNMLPPLRTVSQIPLKVIGALHAEGAAKGSSPPAQATLRGIIVPGALLQGGWIDLILEMDPPNARLQSMDVKAEAVGRGLAVVESSGSAVQDAEGRPSLRVQAAVDAEPGVRTVKVRFRPARGEPVEHEVAIIVRAPVRVTARSGPVPLPAGGTAAVWVSVEREAGYSGPVELRVADLPQGVRMAGRVVIPPEETGAMVRLVRAKSAKPLAHPVALRVMGVARMPKGPVSVDSSIRPMVEDRPAEE